jgi:hypothetical protein
MLLTEDDLQAIDDYTVAKRRLTNRHLFGSGVVCGLEVDCDPCRPGWVTITPGYALDCCGNDIVVGCPEELDVLVLLDELRRRSGVDCGEPCEDLPRRDYLLVVRYDEQPEQPVAPYSQDDCAVGDCEFSRVREGYRFELACDLAEEEPSLFDRLAECLRGGDDKTREDAALLVRLLRLSTTQAAVSAVEAGQAAPAVGVPATKDFDLVERELKSPEARPVVLVNALDLLSRSNAVVTADAVHAAGEGPRVFSGRQRDVVLKRRAQSILGQVEQDPKELASKSIPERLWAVEGYDAAAAPEAFVGTAERFRARLVREMEGRGRGNCEEREAISKLPLDRLDEFSRYSVERLARGYLSQLVACLCDLVNPPCPSCTELRVPLARLRIEDCRVVDVCNLVRDWVPAPRSFNYWLPVLDAVREVLLERCCDVDYGRVIKGSQRELGLLRERGEQALAMVRSPADAPELRPLVGMLRDMAGPSAGSDVLGTGRPVTPAPAAASAAPATAAAASTAPEIAALEAKVAELVGELGRLKGDSGTPPGARA